MKLYVRYYIANNMKEHTVWDIWDLYDVISASGVIKIKEVWIA